MDIKEGCILLIMKPCEESLELRIMSSLHIRMGLPGPDELYYLNLKQGYEGESEFDQRIIPLLDGRLVINDLLLEHHNTLFQIDSLMMSTKSIYLFEVKNYCGDFYVDGERWYSKRIRCCNFNGMNRNCDGCFRI